MEGFIERLFTEQGLIVGLLALCLIAMTRAWKMEKDERIKAQEKLVEVLENRNEFLLKITDALSTINATLNILVNKVE